MSKLAIDNNGNEVSVADDFPTKLVSGVRYLLSSEEQAEYDSSMAAYNAGAVDRAKDRKKGELTTYYKSDTVRMFVYNNHSIKVRDKSIQGISIVRGRLVDNDDVTSLDWYFDDGSVETNRS